MPTARRGKGVGQASLSRGGSRASGASASRTRRSNRLHGGDDVLESEKNVAEDTMEEEVSAGNALLALSRRSRPKETGPAAQSPPEPSVGAAPPRPRRRSAPPPGRWSPASKKSATRSHETKTTKPGGGAPRRLIEQPQAVEAGSPMRRESETTGSSSRAGQTTPPAAHRLDTGAKLSTRAEKGGATSKSASISTAVRRSPRREQQQVRSNTYASTYGVMSLVQRHRWCWLLLTDLQSFLCHTYIVPPLLPYVSGWPPPYTRTRMKV